MTIEDNVVGKLRRLPPEKQRQALKLLESRQRSPATQKPLRSLEGLLEDFNVDITDEEITAARREMWTSGHGFNRAEVANEDD